MNGLTDRLQPIEVRRPDGSALGGEIMYQVNKTKTGYLVLLVNNRGVDKTQNGVARVDRRKFVDVVVRTELPVSSAREQTGPRALALAKGGAGAQIKVRVHRGDVQVVDIVVGKR